MNIDDETKAEIKRKIIEELTGLKNVSSENHALYIKLRQFLAHPEKYV